MAVAEEQGPEKIAVSSAPFFGPSRLLGAVSGQPGCVDRRLLLLPDGRIARSKELRSGSWVPAGEGWGSS